MRRGSDDTRWQSLKEQVKKRDHGCRLIPLLSVKEFLIFQKNAKGKASHCDPAHVFGAGPFPHMIYMLENVVTLNRYSHDCLDNCQNPLTGERITREERDKWWERIVGVETYQHLLDISTRREE